MRGNAAKATFSAAISQSRSHLADRRAATEHRVGGGGVDAEGSQEGHDEGGQGAGEPSSTLTASARPSGRAAAKPPSAPFLASSPGTAPPSCVTSVPVPPTYQGCSRMAVATRCSGVPARAAAIRP